MFIIDLYNIYIYIYIFNRFIWYSSYTLYTNNPHALSWDTDWILLIIYIYIYMIYMIYMIYIIDLYDVYDRFIWYIYIYIYIYYIYI